MSESKTETVPKLDHALAGFVVAFDTETGDVLHVRERLVETIDGKPVNATQITPDECEEVRAEAARNAPRRRVDVIVAPPDAGHPEGERVRYHVDPMTRKLRIEAECDPRFTRGHHFGSPIDDR
jgi:hypothetical protein